MELVVCGRINSGDYHKAKAIAEAVKPSLAGLTLKPLLPAEYDLFLAALQRDVGGQTWGHTAGVAVYTEAGGFIGDAEQLLVALRKSGIKAALPALNSDGSCSSWEELGTSAYASYLESSGQTYTYLEFSADGQKLGRLVFELQAKLLPKTSANFEALCTGANPQGLAYANTPIHRIMAGGWIQGGDLVKGDGSGGASSFGEPLPDESFAVTHELPGVLGMANVGPHTATSQFYITTRPMPTFDRKYVAFGRLIEGGKLLDFIGAFKTSLGKPVADLKVCGCGLIKAEDITGHDVEEAAVKLQALQRSKLARKKVKSEQSAATKVQAIKRGQKARRATTEKVEQDKAATKVQAIKRGQAARAAAKNKK